MYIRTYLHTYTDVSCEPLEFDLSIIRSLRPAETFLFTQVKQNSICGRE